MVIFLKTSNLSLGISVKELSSNADNELRYEKVTSNGPGGHIIQYKAGKAIEASISGSPTSTISINIRDGVILTAFLY